VKLHLTATLLLLASVISLAGKCPAQVHADQALREKRLKQFLRAYDGNPASADERTTRYAAAVVDLGGEGTDEVIVYLIGSRWCGSGGCSALILEPRGSSFTVITKTTVTQLPIRVLSERTNGWSDLGVGVAGGGIVSGYEARLRFNGKKYPSNPTVPPAQRLQKKTEGKVVIPENPKGTPLYGN
jgi:hypothetical protein